MKKSIIARFLPKEDSEVDEVKRMNTDESPQPKELLLLKKQDNSLYEAKKSTHVVNSLSKIKSASTSSSLWKQKWRPKMQKNKLLRSKRFRPSHSDCEDGNQSSSSDDDNEFANKLNSTKNQDSRAFLQPVAAKSNTDAPL